MPETYCQHGREPRHCGSCAKNEPKPEPGAWMPWYSPNKPDGWIALGDGSYKRGDMKTQDE